MGKENENYFFGNPKGDFGVVLDALSHTKVNSFKTSSIPLAGFWNPKNKNQIDEVISKLNKELGTSIDFDKATKTFEYPVYAKDNIGLPSMTDLMIQYGNFNIAIEGKFTEDLYDTISKWKDGISEKSEKPQVLDSWYDYIKPFVDFDFSNENKNEKQKMEDKVVYQFVHRTASACYGCEKGKTPVLIYQLFYDDKNQKSKDHQIKVAEKLKEFANILKFKKELKFLILLTPITNFSNVEKEFGWAKSDLFLKMKRDAVYKFGTSEVKLVK